MRTSRLGTVVAFVNLVLLAVLLARSGTAGERDPAVLRGRALELVDGRNRVRAQLDVEASGEVVLRLRDPEGEIRVKLGAGADGSGLVLMDEATEPAIQMVARRDGGLGSAATTSLRLTGAGGRSRVIAP
jgi:hypothetical protein